MTIRQACKTDIEVLVSLTDEFAHSKTYKVPYDPTHFRSVLEGAIENPMYYIGLLNNDHGELIGMLTDCIFDGRTLAHEVLWYTRPETRGNGFSLFRDFTRWAKENGALAVGAGLPEPHPVMERLGYAKTEVVYFRDLDSSVGRSEAPVLSGLHA